jgi:hypothetical protein
MIYERKNIMGKGIKLNSNEKEIFDNLKWFIKNYINWVGPEENDSELDVMLKNQIKDSGSFAVFGYRHPTLKENELNSKELSEQIFDSLIICTKEEIDAIIEWNPYSHCLAIDIKWLDIIIEIRKPYKPTFMKFNKLINSR